MGDRNSKIRIPNSKRTAAARIALGIAFFAAYGALGNRFHYDRILEDGFFQQSLPMKYVSRNPSDVIRLLTLQLAGVVARFKFYGAWCAAEGACIASGLGFNGFNSEGKPVFTRCRNVDIKNIELAPNWKVLLDSWNQNTNR